MKSASIRPKLLLMLFAIIFLSACSSMYIPSVTNTPLLEKQGEKQIELSASTNSVHFAAAYAFTSDLAISINGNLSYKNFTGHYDVFTMDQESGKESEHFLFNGSEFAHKYAELSLGKFDILNSKRRLEVFSGLGYGNASDNYYDKFQFEEKYLAGFVQINYGITGRFYAAGGALRLSATTHDYSYQIDPSLTYPELNNGNPQKLKFTMWHIEPFGFIRFGGENLQIIVREGFSIGSSIEDLGDMEMERGIHYGKLKTTRMHFSIGLNYKFGMDRINKISDEE